MHPYLIQLGNFKIPTYGFMIALGYLTAMSYILKKIKKENIDRKLMIDIVFYTVLSGIIGGKILYIITFWSYFGDNIGEKIKNIFTFDTLTSGFVFYGGFITAIITLYIFTKIKNIKFLKLADIISPASALAHAIGRIGCFSAGCCHGKPTQSICGVIFSNPQSLVKKEYLNIPIHPTQLYESFGNLLIFLLLNFISSKKYFKKNGYIFFSYLISYSILRFIIEFYRGDERGVLYLNLSQAQIISAFTILLSISGIIYIRKKNYDN